MVGGIVRKESDPGYVLVDARLRRHTNEDIARVRLHLDDVADLFRGSRGIKYSPTPAWPMWPALPATNFSRASRPGR